MRQYFRDIYLTIKTILIGMRITLKYCFAKTVTVQYPDVAPVLQPRFRGFHHYQVEKCIACDQCARACPVDCITIEKSGPRKLDKTTGLATGGVMLRYAIDYTKCMFCGLCTEPCPTKCLQMGDVHDISCYSRRDAVVEFTELAKQGLQTPQPLWVRSDRLPAWAEAAKRRWIEQGQDRREQMLAAVVGTTGGEQPAGARQGASGTPDN